MSILWTPDQIETALWLDADDGDSFTLTGAAIDEWRDKSGNARHATPATANKPAVVADRLNGLPGVHMDAASVTRALVTPSFANPSGADGVSVFMVIERTGSPVSFSIPVVKGPTNSQWSVVFSAPAGNSISTLRNDLAAGNSASSGAGAIPSAPWLYGGMLSSAAIRQFGNGSLLSGSQGAAGRSFGSSSALVIGGSPDSSYAANRFQGYLHEVIVLHDDADDETRQLIEGYLAHKWGLEASLPVDHPYKTEAPSVIGVSGVVRDDAGDPAERTVRVYARSTGALLEEVLSDPVTGAYSVVTASAGEVQVVVLDDSAGELYNDIIMRVVPE